MIVAVLVGLASCGGGSADTAPDDETGALPVTADLRFVDEAQTRGLTEAMSAIRTFGDVQMNGAAGVEDFDADGDLDIYLPRYNLANLYLSNDGEGHFSPVDVGLDVEGASGPPVVVDFDNDGDRDLFVSPTNYGIPFLMRNDGGAYVDVTVEAGIELERRDLGGEHGSFAYATTAFDVDNDRDLDLFVAEWGKVEQAHRVRDTQRGYLFVNKGGMHFEERSDDFGLGLLREVAALTATAVDYSGDGSLDLLITGDFGTSKVLRSIRGERFVDETAKMLPGAAAVLGVDTGSAAGSQERVYNAMGSAIGPVGQHGGLGWFVTAIGQPDEADDCFESADGLPQRFGLVVRCSGNRLFDVGSSGLADRTMAAGVRDGGWGWGAAIFDADLDGNHEIAMTNGYTYLTVEERNEEGLALKPGYEEAAEAATASIGRASRIDRNKLWALGGDDRYVDVAGSVGFDSALQGRALIAFDADNDGDPDVLQINNGVVPPQLWINQGEPRHDWVKVRVEVAAGPPDCVGCVVELSRGDWKRTFLIRAGGGYVAHEPTEILSGVGGSSGEVTVRVHAPGGTAVEGTAALNKLTVIR